jgi:hypothetical protein
MARKSPSVNTLRIELRRERRTNRRLRVLIDDLKAQVRANRSDLDVQFTRLAQLQLRSTRSRWCSREGASATFPRQRGVR